MLLLLSKLFNNNKNHSYTIQFCEYFTTTIVIVLINIFLNIEYFTLIMYANILNEASMFLKTI